MRILMINKFLYPRGGAETYMLRVGEQLTKMGHEVQYFGMYDERNVVGNQVNSYTKNVDFHEKRLSAITYPFKIIYSNENRQKLKIVLDDFKPDIVHLNNINFQLTPAIIDEIYNHHIPMVQTVHDLQMLCPNHLMFQDFKVCERCKGGNYMECIKHKCIHNSLPKSVIGTLESYLYHMGDTYSKVDTYICPSRFMEEKLLEYSDIYKDKTIFLQNFIELPTMKGLQKKPYVLYFGRFYEEKGIRVLLDAIKLCPNIHFVFAGDGPLKDLITGQNIEYVGFQTGDDLRNLIEEASVSIYPSIWYENCPLSVLESESLGTPVIASNLGGIPELIEDNVTGKMIPEMNAEKIAETIQDVMGNPSLLEKMQKECVKKRDIFISLTTYGEILEKIYEKTCEKI